MEKGSVYATLRHLDEKSNTYGKFLRHLGEWSQEFSQHNFVSAEYIDEQGKPRPSYEITRDGFTFLAMGFTGGQAALSLVTSDGGLKPQALESIMNTITQATPEFRPNITVVDGKIKTTPLAIADHFGKAHYRVLRAIEKLECSQEFSAANFGAAEYIDEQGKPRPSYEITRDGFTFLAMGFTGGQAALSLVTSDGGFNPQSRGHIMNTITQSTPEFRPNIAVIDGKIKTTPSLSPGILINAMSAS